jgi:hypothetical protein
VSGTALLLVAAIALSLPLVVAALSYGEIAETGPSATDSSPQSIAAGAGRVAVLLDQIGSEGAQDPFSARVIGILSEAGFSAEVVTDDRATVGAYRDLPGYGAGLYILRSHSAVVMDGGRITDDVALFTSEPVDLTSYAVTDLPDPIVPALGTRSTGSSASSTLSDSEIASLVPVRHRSGGDRKPYLGIGSDYVRQQLVGRFPPNAIVILMGCDTMRDNRLSEAFLARGAGAVIGWDNQVTLAHTDAATEVLVRDLAEGRTVEEALYRVAVTVGVDPVSGANLIAAVSEDEHS